MVLGLPVNFGPLPAPGLFDDGFDQHFTDAATAGVGQHVQVVDITYRVGIPGMGMGEKMNQSDQITTRGRRQ